MLKVHKNVVQVSITSTVNVPNVEKSEANTVAEEPFNYDLERMKKAVESPSVAVPDSDNFEEFDKWLMSL